MGTKKLIEIDKETIKKFLLSEGYSLYRLKDMTEDDFKRIIKMHIFDEWFSSTKQKITGKSDLKTNYNEI